MTVKRYTPTQCCEHGGTYVTYSDYQKLVAENVALKKYAKIDDYDKCDNCGFESYVMPIETPATDAAVAEIKASELDDLAKSIMEYAPVIESDEYHVYEAIAKDVTDRAANLRAGRKG